MCSNSFLPSFRFIPIAWHGFCWWREFEFFVALDYCVSTYVIVVCCNIGGWHPSINYSVLTALFETLERYDHVATRTLFSLGEWDVYSLVYIENTCHSELTVKVSNTTVSSLLMKNRITLLLICMYFNQFTVFTGGYELQKGIILQASPISNLPYQYGDCLWYFNWMDPVATLIDNESGTIWYGWSDGGSAAVGNSLLPIIDWTDSKILWCHWLLDDKEWKRNGHHIGNCMMSHMRISSQSTYSSCFSSCPWPW